MSQARSDRPFVTANFAVTWDGRISTRNHTPSDFSSPRDKQRLLEIRSGVDAILASAKTIAADRMTMGLPDEKLRVERIARGQAEYPTRVLLTNSGQISADLPVFEKHFSPVIVFSTTLMPPSTQETLASRAAIHLTEGACVDLPAMMETLRRKYEIQSLVCEGGGQIFRSLLKAGLVDELHLTLCPRVFGSTDAPTISGASREYLPASVHWKLEAMEQEGDECFLRYRIPQPV